MVPFVIDKNLCLVLQTAKGSRVNNPVPVPLISRSQSMLFFCMPAAAGLMALHGIRSKRRIILGTDRPMAMGEVMSGSRSQENNISFVTLQLDSETGEGTGQMVFGAEFKHNKKTGQLEIKWRWDPQPEMIPLDGAEETLAQLIREERTEGARFKDR